MTENPITETPATESETAEDLLARIKRQTQERLEELSAAVEESKRLRAELEALEAQPEMLGEDLGIEDADPQTGQADPGSEEREPEPLSNVIRLPAARQPPHRPIVSPKVARLMGSRQSLSIERPGAPLDEVDEEAQQYERAS
jgi:hypothetical protein